MARSARGKFATATVVNFPLASAHSPRGKFSTLLARPNTLHPPYKPQLTFAGPATRANV
jgi:hypothetical protein